MKEGFRQSMAWLHTWTGILVGWVLYFVFLTGTFGYVNAEVDRWMRPELPLAATRPAATELVQLAETRLRAEAPDASSWWITLPGGRTSYDLSIDWQMPGPTPNEEAGTAGASGHETLDQRTGEPSTLRVRDTGGGQVLYAMHYKLHYVPLDVAIQLVGLCTMFMLVAMLSGVVVHKKIFKDFFTFRPGRGQRSWLDAHNLLSVSALPFHLMITWSGLVFFVFAYMPVSLAFLYPEGPARERFYDEIRGVESETAPAQRGHAGTLTSLSPLLRRAEQEWGRNGVAYVSVSNPGRDTARVTLFARTSLDVGRDTPLRQLHFGGTNGILLNEHVHTTPGGAMRLRSVLLGLHEGLFAGPFLRLLYVIAGLVGTAMIGTALTLWSTKRKQALLKTSRPHFGIVAVDVLNLGTLIGLPLGIATYFWANRLLPVDMAERAAWEVHVMFMTWGGTFLYAIWRPLRNAWVELCSVTAIACGFLPVLNALTTDRHLGVTIAAGDGALAGFDLLALATGILFALMARRLHRNQGVTTGNNLSQSTTLRAGADAEVTE